MFGLKNGGSKGNLSRAFKETAVYQKILCSGFLYKLLNKAPVTPLIHHDNIHLRVDATCFKKFCVVCYQDNSISYTQLFRFSDAERYEEIKEDLKNLLAPGLQIASITCDGHKATLKAIHKVLYCSAMPGTCPENVPAVAYSQSIL